MDQPTRQDLQLLYLDERAVIRAEGADADAFLQGQLSNDLRQLNQTRGQLSSYNSPKGRMLAVLTLTRAASSGVDLELPRSLLDPVLRRLRLFVLRSKVSLRESPDAMLGVSGAAAIAALQDAGLSSPKAALDVTRTSELQLVRRHGASPRFTIQGPKTLLDALASSWPQAERIDAAAWALADLRAGLPVVLPPTQDRFVAQMANLDQLGGISFDKGCYTGQEIVARLHYLGQLKRRMFWSSGQGATPAPGAPVHDGEGGQAVGEVVNAVTVKSGFEAAVVLQLTHAESSQLRCGDVALASPKAFSYL